MKIYRAVKDFDDDIKKDQLVYVEPKISNVNSLFYNLRLPNKSNFRSEPRWKMEIDRNALDLFFKRVVE